MKAIKSEKFAIVGGGFGLYGYLPALISIYREGIILPENYRSILLSRKELKIYDGRIDWQPTVQHVISKATGLVIAIPPDCQYKLVKEIISLEKIKKIILEKPMAVNPFEADEIINDISNKSKSFRVGYTFLYSSWYTILKKIVLKNQNDIQVIWKFKAHHILTKKETWKRYHSLGGGVLRFYGIHLIAVLASLGYSEIVDNRLFGDLADQPTSWNVRAVGKSVPECNIFISINSDHEQFIINSLENLKIHSEIYSKNNPFQFEQKIEYQDIRVNATQRLIDSFNCEDFDFILLYQATNKLWAKADIFSRKTD